MRAAACLLFAACGTTSSSSVGVVALAGDAAAPGAIVVAQRADGTVLDDQTADADGRAELAIEPGAYVTVVYAASAASVATTAVTALARADGGDLVVHGPPVPSPPAGQLALTGAPPDAAAYAYEIVFGCATVAVAAPPTTAPLPGCAIAAAAQASALVFAYGAADPAGSSPRYYAAGEIDATTSTPALDIAAWRSGDDLIEVPVVDPGPFATVALAVADGGAVFPAAVGTDPACSFLWKELPVAGTIARATIATGAMERYTAGAPTSIAVGADDFAAAIDPAPVRAAAGLAVSWRSLAGATANAIDLEVASSAPAFTWSVVMPPDATQIAFPALAGELAAPPPATASATLFAADSSAVDGYAALEAAGIAATAPSLARPSIATPSAGGELRYASAVVP